MDQFTIQIKIIFILLGSVHYLRVAKDGVVYVEITFPQGVYFSQHFIDRSVSDLWAEDVGHRAKPAVIWAASCSKYGIH